MAIGIRVAPREPFDRFFDRAITRAAKRDVTIGVRAAVEGLKTDLRQDVHRAGLGLRLPNAIRAAIYPRRGESFAVAGEVGVKDPKAAEVLAGFATGVTIRSAAGFWLAIPLPAAGAVAGSRNRKRLTPGLWEQRTGLKLRFVYTGRSRAFLVADNATAARSGRGVKPATARRKAKGRAGKTVPIFLLVRQVRLAKRVDPDAIAKRWAELVPDLIARAAGRD